MSCCHEHGCGEFFSEKLAARDARRYRKKGLDGISRRVFDALTRRGVAGATVLEVGGGNGAIQLELLKAGAAGSVNVELSPAYERHARELAAEAGLADRVERRLLDFAARADELEPADVVVLNRVVCCYPDYDRLVGAAAEHARGRLVLTFPRDAWWTRAGVAASNGWLRLRGNTFRAFVHPPAAIAAAARRRGLDVTDESRGLVWQLAAFERAV
jgi:magnesium-protoporphyrin O-methyltransferase